MLVASYTSADAALGTRRILIKDNTDWEEDGLDILEDDHVGHSLFRRRLSKHTEILRYRATWWDMT